MLRKAAGQIQLDHTLDLCGKFCGVASGKSSIVAAGLHGKEITQREAERSEHTALERSTSVEQRPETHATAVAADSLKGFAILTTSHRLGHDVIPGKVR